MSESSSWGTLRKYLVRDLQGCDIQRIEDKLASGIPDSNVCWRGREFWLEGKQLRELPVRDSTAVRVDMSQEQLNWAVARKEAGGLAYVWIRVNNVGWWLIENTQDMERLEGKREFFSKKEFLQLTHFTTCAEFVRELKDKLWNS
jgi:hypothetical protein